MSEIESKDSAVGSILVFFFKTKKSRKRERKEDKKGRNGHKEIDIPFAKDLAAGSILEVGGFSIVKKGNGTSGHTCSLVKDLAVGSILRVGGFSMKEKPMNKKEKKDFYEPKKEY